MHPWTFRITWAVLLLVLLAAAPQLETPPATDVPIASTTPVPATPIPSTSTPPPTPVPWFIRICESLEPNLRARCEWWGTNIQAGNWIAIGATLLALAGIAFMAWVVKSVWGKKKEILGKFLDLFATRRYLNAFIAENKYFGFRGIEMLAIKPIELDQGYVSLDLILQREAVEIAHLQAQKQETAELLRSPLETGQRPEPIDITQAISQTSTLAIVGDAGSGKSALLQWAGLSLARYRLSQKLKPEQRKFIKALHLHPWSSLVPVIIPLRNYQSYCKNKELPRNTGTLVQFMENLARTQYRALNLPDDFFMRLLRRGCLFMFDGVDEVDYPDRPAVRAAMEGVIGLVGNHRRNRYLITMRPSAANIAEQIADFRRADVQPLSDEKIRTLVQLWCTSVYPAHLADQEAEDFLRRLMDEQVRAMADTPLMVNIFALVRYHKRVLPNQRAELYEYAVQALLMDPHKSGQAVADLETWGGLDWKQRRDALALIAFILHDTGASDIQADVLVSREDFWKRFGSDAEQAKGKAEEFLELVARRGGLLRQDGQRFSFYIRRFQEFLAARHLAQKLEDQWEKYIRKHVTNDQWEEPIQLAIGFLAYSNLEKAEKFMRQLVELEGSEEQRNHAVALAGLSLANLLKFADEQVKHVFSRMSARLPAQMKAILEVTPPPLKTRLRYNLGLALGELGDPRLAARVGERFIRPELVHVPAGPFRMGTNDEDIKRLEAQDTRFWTDEQPDHIVTLSEFFIGKYPVTNAEFRCFWEVGGYGDSTGEKPSWWSNDGWLWRIGQWESDLTIYPEELQKDIRRWLQSRPVRERDRPLLWDDPEWSAFNLPVVGVCWFEAEAYCNWLSFVTKEYFRLPSEAEWEKAARGTESRLWPWGDIWDSSRCNNAEPEDKIVGPSPVGIYPHGASPYGALDMVGNVWEWCFDWYVEDEYQRRVKLAQPVKDPRGPQTGQARVLRGGSWLNRRNLARCASRFRNVPVNFYDLIGFRVVLSPKSS